MRPSSELAMPSSPETGRLSVPAAPRVHAPSTLPGSFALGLDRDRDGLLFVPHAAAAGKPLPLVVAFHGAGADAHQSIAFLRAAAEEHGFLLLAPDSQGRTWDLIEDHYGPDVRFLQRALDKVFATYPVDRSLVAAAGFSDGASYALSLAITNGDLFTHAIAFSPGFAAPLEQHGAPRLFVSHGVNDVVLPVARCSRTVVPRLRKLGYDVRYDEFPGGHEIPARTAADAVRWFLSQGPSPQTW